MMSTLGSTFPSRAASDAALRQSSRLDSEPAQSGNSISQSLPDHERIVHDLIWQKQTTGIWMRDLKEQIKLPDKVVAKSLKSLQQKSLIKQVVNIHNKSRKHFMAIEFEPSSEITGGSWYVDGNLDIEFIGLLREQCYSMIQQKNVATVGDVWGLINKLGFLKVEISMEQVSEIVKALVLDNEVMEVRSGGSVWYKCVGRGGGSKVGAMASIPCGVCPHIHLCSPNGVINPSDCVYFNKFLEF